ncbi:hypothetical protein ABZ626_26205 [Streptomyces longispororuber]|uniref:hypothetical protein n=1 Tax=Streptomyces longispororuber TaxID=68230 RepID=UPI0033D17172
MQNLDIDMDLQEFRGILGEALAEGGSQRLLRLTDEEIAVLDPDSLTDCVAPTPRLGRLSEQERAWAYATALRSLVSREAVEIGNVDELDALLRTADADPETAGQPSGVDVDMRIAPEVSLALTLRRSADRALAVEQHTSGGVAHTLVYAHSADLLLVERITAGGLHMFSLASSAADAAEVVRLFVDPFEVADQDGRPQQLTSEQIAAQNVGRPLNEAINGALVVGQLVVLADAPGPLLTTYATGEAVWTVHVEKPQAASGITARAVGTNTLRKMITQLILPS